MSRKLSAWATSRRPRTRPRITWFRDIRGFAKTGFGQFAKPPANAPEPSPDRESRLSIQDLRRHPALLNIWSWRLTYHVVGLEALEGIEAPVIFAVNEQGVLDWTVLRNILPPRLRTQRYSIERSILKGKSVAIFSQDPTSQHMVGEFTPQAAELAHHYNLPVVPVALVGTFGLPELRRLSLRRKPSVSVRFGALIYVRGRTTKQATQEIQASVEALFNRGDLSWWAVQQPSKPALTTAPAVPRWVRLWRQSKPRHDPKSQVWNR